MFKTPRSFSYSSASVYKQCPRRWKHKYIDKLPDPTGEAALVGTFAHEVLEELCKEEPSLRTEARANEIAATIWPKSLTGKTSKILSSTRTLKESSVGKHGKQSKDYGD